MKNTAMAVLLGLALVTATPATGEAKPAYCTVALNGCYAECLDYFGDNVLGTACQVGCLIGYLDCGPA